MRSNVRKYLPEINLCKIYMYDMYVHKYFVHVESRDIGGLFR